MRGISSLIDTDMDDSTQFVDENMIISSASESELSKKKVVQPKTTENRVSKPKAAPRKPKAGKEEGAKKVVGKATGTKRKALDQQVNGETQQASKKISHVAAAPSDDELDGVTGAEKSRQEVNQKPKRKPRAKKDTEAHGDDSEQGPSGVQRIHAQTGSKKPKVAQKVIANDPHSTVQELDNSVEAHAACSPQQPAKKSIRSMSQSRQENVFRRRAGSASDTERGGGDPNLRRKLGDVTRKFENIDLKYRNLKDVGIVEANANIEKLRKQCEATTSASAELITSLKKELAMQMPLAHDARQLQIDLQNYKQEASKYRSEATDLQSSLVAAQNEIKALQAKLAAARSSATCVESATSKTPGSAMKNSIQARNAMVGGAEAAQAAQTAQLKEDLYSDLSGLIIRSVKRTEEGDAYDCIQTGRNGSKYIHPKWD